MPPITTNVLQPNVKICGEMSHYAAFHQVLQLCAKTKTIFRKEIEFVI